MGHKAWMRRLPPEKTAFFRRTFSQVAKVGELGPHDNMKAEVPAKVQARGEAMLLKRDCLAWKGAYARCLNWPSEVGLGTLLNAGILRKLSKLHEAIQSARFRYLGTHTQARIGEPQLRCLPSYTGDVHHWTPGHCTS